MSKVENPIELATKVVDVALDAGAIEADVYLQSSNNIDLSLRNGELESVRQASTTGLALRVTVNGSTALVHTTDMGLIGLMKLVMQAVEMAKILPRPKDPIVYANTTENHAGFHPDPGLAGESVDAKVKRLAVIEKAMLSVSGVSASGGTSYSENDGEIALVNSNGVKLYSPFSRIELSAEAYAEDDEASYTGTGYNQVSSRATLKDPEVIGREAGQRAASQVGARQIPSTSAPVIFTPQTGFTFMTCLASPLRGDNVALGRSYFADQIGQKIAGSNITIIDDPTMDSGPASRAFDGEGMPARKMTMIADGVLQSYFTDLLSATKLGCEPGGHGVRGSYNSKPGIGTSNYSLAPGNKSRESIIKETGRGLLLNSLSGWWVGISPVNDAFSSAITGYWIEDGAIAYPVKSTSIAGSLRDMLGSIDMIGDDLRFAASTATPTFRVAEMSISGT